MGYVDRLQQEQVIRKTLHDSFGWALTKDKGLFESIFTHDNDFFTFYPDSKSTVNGWEHFTHFLDQWMDPRSTATGYEIHDLRVVIS